MGGLHLSSIGGEDDAEFLGVPSTLGHLLDQLRMKYQMEIRRDSTLILVNGVEARALDDLETLISEDDELVLVPMFHGG